MPNTVCSPTIESLLLCNQPGAKKKKKKRMDKLSNYLKYLDSQDQEKEEERDYYYRRLMMQGYRDEHEKRNYKNQTK